MAKALTPEDIAFIQQVGRRVRELRELRGLSQERAARRFGTTMQNFARIERGQNVTLALLRRVAAALGVAPTELLAAPMEVQGPLADLEQLGWQQVAAERRPQGAIPAFDLRAAAGRELHHAAVETLAWLLPPPGRRLVREGLFLARASGTAMAPLVPDAAWCLFRAPVVPPLVRKILLLQRRALGDDEVSGGYWLKRVGAVEATADHDRLRVRLDSIDKDQPPIFVEVEDESDLAAQGEFVEVVQQPSAQVPQRRRPKPRVT